MQPHKVRPLSPIFPFICVHASFIHSTHSAHQVLIKPHFKKTVNVTKTTHLQFRILFTFDKKVNYYETETDSKTQKTNSWLSEGKWVGEDINKEFGISRCKLLYIKETTKPYSIAQGNIQYPVINHNGKEYERNKCTCRLPRWLSGKESSCREQKRHGFNRWVRKIPWGRKWQPLQFSCLENAMDTRAWWATVHRVTKSQTRLIMHTYIHV